MKKDSTSLIITRFAPSPTGFLHIGSIRTALYGYLLAKKSGGKFILRIEDTDKVREVQDGVEIIHQTLLALKLNWDQEFKQSDRLDIYKKWAEKLVQKGLAYADNVKPEEVETWREDAKLKHKPFLYRNYITEERKLDWVYGKNSLRLKSNPKRWNWYDEVRGNLTAGEEAIDDLVLIKADGYPTYNFCHIVDDYEMGITHILRSDEFISSTPKFLGIYEALEITPPKFVTLPPIMAPGGKKKLGKRDGAKDALEYLADGVLVEALINFLALLGWNPGKGSEKEIFSLEELIEAFSITGIGKSGANYDTERLKWINGHHIRALSLDELYKRSKSFMPEEAVSFPEFYQKQVLSLVQERLKFLSELPELTWFFFKKPEISKAELLDVKGLENYSPPNNLTPASNSAPPPAPPLSEEGRVQVEALNSKGDVNWEQYKDLSRENRKNQTEAEKKLWQELRANKLSVKFRRQHVIEGYIVDFWQKESNLVIEVDGSYHYEEDQIGYDQARTETLQALNLNIVRFSNDEVINNLPSVLEKIRQLIANPAQQESSSERGGQVESVIQPGGAETAKTMLTHTLNLIQQIPVEKWSSESIQLKLNQALEDLHTKPAILFALLRNALTGAKFTPPLADMMAVLGKNEVEERLSSTINTI